MYSGIINRKTQSYASSPHYLSDFLKSSQSSPLLKESPEVEKLVKSSLKRFKSEKAELERIKEIALSFKSTRQKKLKSYNLQTRLGNKMRVKIKRPNTVWVSPESKEFWNEAKKNKPRHPLSSVERRANIGLEHFNLKSPRNHTPKDVKDEKKINNVEGNRKKGIEDFIKKKKKERIEEERKKKIMQHENELKRMKMLEKVEKKAKCALRKKKKVKSKKKECVKIVPESFELAEKRKNSDFKDEDEEVFKIIHKSVINGEEPCQDSDRHGKEAKNYIEQGKILISKPSKINIKLKKGRKSSKLSQNMPIIELLSISHSSSSDLSEQKKHLQKQIEDIRNRMDSIKDNEKYTKITLLKAQNALKTIVLKFLSEKFFLIKYSNFSNNNSVKQQSRESSEDMERIWDKIETFRPLEFLQDNDSVSSLIPFDESLRNSRQNSKRPSEDLDPNELFKRSSADQEPIKIREVSEESSFETELYLDEKIHFGKNISMKEVLNEPEPQKADFLPQKQNKCEILIDDASESVLDIAPFIKETEERSYIETPEAEELEEFNCAEYEKIVEEKSQDYESNSYTIILEDTIEIIVNEILIEFISLAAEDEYNKTYFQLVGNNRCIVYDICVRTGVTAVMKFVEKLWSEVDLNTIRNRITDKSLHLHILSCYRQDFWSTFDGIISKKTLRKLLKKLVDNQVVHLAVEIHNKAIFEAVNEILFKISKVVSPVPWKNGKLCVTGLDLNKIYKDVNLQIRKFCMVNAGRIANVSMVNAEGVVDLELLQRIRENGLTSLLTAEIEQIEKDWVDYEAEEHQTVNELSSYILDELAYEVADIMFFKNI